MWLGQSPCIIHVELPSNAWQAQKSRHWLPPTQFSMDDWTNAVVRSAEGRQAGKRDEKTVVPNECPKGQRGSELKVWPSWVKDQISVSVTANALAR